MNEEAKARKMREVNMFSNGAGGGSPTVNGANGAMNGAQARTSSTATTTVGGGDVDSVHSSESEGCFCTFMNL